MCPAANKNGYQAADSSSRTPWLNLSPAERNEYIEKYSPLIRYVADRLASRLPPSVARDDLVSAGILGLIDAVDKFDASRKILFKTYAEFRIKGAMLDELRSMDWVPRSVRKKSSQLEKAYQVLEAELGRPATDDEVAGALKLSIEEFHRLVDDVKGVGILDFEFFRNASGAGRGDLFELVADEETKDALMVLGLSEARQIVAEAITALPEKERLVVTLYYFEELTMKEVGEVMGYTESRISQLHTKCLMRLRGRLRRYFNPSGA